jgi:hypothetical protein
MSDEDLRDLLAQLHARLGRAKSLDGQSRKLLTTVARDIETALGTGTTPKSKLEPIEQLAVRFEADHPAVADVLRQIVDTLGKAGI